MNSLDRKKISPQIANAINRFVPEHIRQDHPDLIAFVQAYFRYLENEHESGYFQNTLPEQRDIRTQDKVFLQRIEKELGLFVPREYEATPLLFYDKISELWRSKGSEEAIKTFFQLLLADTVQIRYPWDRVLKPSDGVWNEPQKLRIAIIQGDPDDFLGQRIQQIEEYGLGTVERIERKPYADITLFELSLARGQTFGNFIPGNRITSPDINAIAEIYNSVSRVNIINGGSGYRVGDRIRLRGLSRISFEARVTRVNADTGEIEAVTLIDFGSGTTPQFIRDVRGSGQYFLDEFQVFSYLDDDRTLLLGDSEDISGDGIQGFTQDYSESIYFGGSYGGNIVFEEDDPDAVNNPLTVDFIESSPVDPSEPFEFEVITRNGTGADFEVLFGGLVRAAGFYENSRGQLSSNIVLQDSVFFQKFSYEIITSNPINTWIDPLKRHLNPAGLAPFSLLNQQEEIDVSVSIFQKVVKLKPLEDTVNTSDSISITSFKFVNLSDDIETQDSINTLLTINEFLSDSVITDDEITSISGGKLLSDSANADDTITSFGFNKSVSDSANADDLLVFNINKSVSDTAEVDDFSPTFNNIKSLTDSINATESISISTSFNEIVQTLQEFESNQDTLVIDINKVVTDTVETNDLIEPILIQNLILGDELNTNESLTVQVNKSLIDSAAGEETPAFFVDKLVGDAVTTGESISIQFNKSLVDSISSEESLSTQIVNGITGDLELLSGVIDLQTGTGFFDLMVQ